MIKITGNYYTDLEAAIAAGIIVKNGKNPSKVEVYTAIENYNGAIAVDAPTLAEPQPTAEPTSEELLALDAAEDARKAVEQAAKPKRQKKVKGPSKLELLVQAMESGIADIDTLAQISGMKPQGVKGWVGVIRNQGIDNWKQSNRKQAV
jgi:hypothetical protein